jgi:glycosyltransferase involved in cell wall biosynthesis
VRHPAVIELLLFLETYAVGGAERFVLDLTHTLDPSRYAITVAGHFDPSVEAWLAKRLPPRIRRQRVRVVHPSRSAVVQAGRSLAPGGTGSRSLPRRTARAAARYGDLASNSVPIARALRALRPDVVHINNGGYPAADSCRVASIAARAAGVPRVVHFVHGWADPPEWPARAELALDRLVDRSVDVWGTPADAGRRRLHEQRGIPLERIAVVQLGHRDGATAPEGRSGRRAELGVPEGVPAILAAGSLFEYKGHRYLVEALGELAAAWVAAHVLLAGSGPEEERLAALAHVLGVGDRVSLLGWVDDVGAVMAAADVFVLPSTAIELSPYSVREAMAHGLPVVASGVGGVPELVEDGVTGLLVPPADASALASALRVHVENPNRARAMGEAGRRRLEAEFDVRRMVAAVERLYAG